MSTIVTNELAVDDYDWEKERKAFDETKAGTKGLVDSGINILPKMFIQPVDEMVQSSSIHDATTLRVPVIDLAGLEKDNDRERIVEEVLDASQKWGFFHVLNHGIPMDVLDGMIEGIKMFHEQDLEAKKEFYSRVIPFFLRCTSHFERCTFDWNAILDHTDQVLKLGNTILELLSLALGLKPDCLKEMKSDKGWTCVYHYYPPCPQPEIALGTEKHSDSSFITLLFQNHIGGLQVLHENQWVDVQPIPGALIINIGDILQMISNDKLTSVLHRVRANRVGPRVSAAFFFTGLVTSPKTYSPIKDLITEQNPAMYREFTVAEFLTNYFTRSLNEDRFKHFMI
ncbi:hypothetical protein KSS87_020835 [Heliosperma pusillum]|nr:hypothetical protein KSS87_020835 [Heliosperma pusillum]